MVKLLCVAAFLALAVAVSAFEATSFASHMNPFLRVPLTETITGPSSRATVANTILQRVDNFDIQNEATFEQRYLQNGEYFQPGGPLIVLLSGFHGIDAERFDDSFPLFVANELKGYAFYLEHRYYGQSYPVANLTNDNLRFLNVDQALADIAHFVNHIKRSDVIPGAEESEVIVVGRHYSANLAVWFRQKYPHLALGAWASSAPVLSVVNQYQYKETAARTFRQIGGDSCYYSIQRSFDYIESLIRADRLDDVSALFSLCPNSYLRNERSINLFFALLAEVFSFVVQLSSPQSITNTCYLLQDHAAESPAHALLSVFEYLANATDGAPSDWCLTLDYDSIIAEDRRVELDSLSAITGIRQRTYQQCTQLGWHHTSDSRNQPFGHRFPLQFSMDACQDVFREVLDLQSAYAASNRINIAHGGLHPQVTNVIFTHGDLDPWRTIGVQRDLNRDARVLVIPGSAQSVDLYGFSERDTQEQSDAKIAIKDTIRTWLAEELGVDVDPY